MEAATGPRPAEDEEQEVACECCGFTEECTAPYIASVRARYGGRWICGLCGDAVAEEIGRASPAPLSPADALDRHARVCGQGRASAPPSPTPGDDELIAALRLLLRRRLGSPSPPRMVRSTPSSPRRDRNAAVGSAAAAAVAGPGAIGGGAGSLARTESCFAALVE
ncbi:uncharacterized protein LOC124669482 [Lolium rigidum]|uniref:uncharacterized protein LOC124669482 n=1 Tax=Lolium rigidum TaxID=89674 RepID=UPI001F5E327D|nr:uncharacterized protein LOC124669482 [Lolium rigidum]